MAKNAWFSRRVQFSVLLSAGVLCAGNWVHAQPSVSEERVPILTQPLRELTNLGTHAGWVSSVTFSPKNKRIVTGGTDQKVKIWDEAGKLHLVVEKVGSAVEQAILSPDEHELLIVAQQEAWVLPLPNSDEKGVVATIDFQKQTGKWMVSREAARAAFSPAGDRIAIGTTHGKIIVWSQATKKKLFTLTATTHQTGIYCVSFSADGTRILSSNLYGTRVWDTSKKTLLFTTKGAFVPSEGVFFPNGNILLMDGALQGEMQVRNVQDGVLLRTFKGNHSDGVATVALSLDGTRIVTASDDGTARVRDAQTGDIIAVLQSHVAYVTSASFLSDAQHVVTAGRDGTVRLWDLTQSKPTGVVLTDSTLLPAHQSAIRNLSVKDRWVATAGADNVVRIWDKQGNVRMLLYAFTNHIDDLEACVFSPTQNQLALQIKEHRHVGEEETYPVITKLIELPVIPLQGPAVNVYANELKILWSLEGSHPAFSPDGQRLAVAKADGTVEIWSLSNKTKLTTFTGHSRASMVSKNTLVYSIKFSADGNRIATGGNDQMAYVWDANTGAKLLSLTGHTHGVGQAAFSPDGSRIVTISVGESVRVWDARTGASVLPASRPEDWFVAAAFIPNGKQFVTAGESGSVYLHDAQTGRLLKRMAPVGKSKVETIEVTEKEIYASYGDGRVLVWPLTETAQPAR